MSKFIKTNKKKIIISILIALVTTFIYILFKIKDKIIPECTVPYLNPWQHFISCNLVYGLHYLIVFISIFIIAFYIMKKLKIVKEKK